MNKLEPNWQDVESFIDSLAKECGEVCGVYGPPRGGLVFAVMLSHRLHVPMLMAPCNRCLIVDDICDKGDTLYHYRATLDCKIATMYYVKGASVTPDFWMLEKDKNDWVVFPWEASDNEKACV